jgi:hypothetical protein
MSTERAPLTRETVIAREDGAGVSHYYEIYKTIVCICICIVWSIV